MGFALLNPSYGLNLLRGFRDHALIPILACRVCRLHDGAMNNLSNMSTSELDEYFLRRSFEVARRSLTHGNHPFGAILVDADRAVLIETENGYMPSHDGTAHAERLLATQACTTLSADVLKG